MAIGMSDILMTRRHRIYSARIAQLRNNLLVLNGGRPYIDARLHRAPNESDMSWAGNATLPARRERAFLVNDAGRVASKIEHYLFSQPATRTAIDESFAADVTTTGLTVHSFWREACNLFTAGQWCWLQVDRGAPLTDPETGLTRPRTLAQRDADGDRVYWSMWSSAEVVDWCFDTNGDLLWLLTDDVMYDNLNPRKGAKEQLTRILWQRGNGGGATWERYQLEGSNDQLISSGTISIRELPFVLVGIPQNRPWWFDDIEMIQCALLNVGSLNHENLVKTVFPQLVVPASMIMGLEATLQERHGLENGQQIVEVVRELIRGLDRPFVESSEDNGLTRYLTPNAADLKALPEEEERRRKQLFDIAGLALFNRETRQVQTAEAKAFDHLDTSSTLRNRALLLQEAEQKMIQLSRALDSSFSEYEPVWPHDFDVPNTGDDVDSLTRLANFTDMTPQLKRQVMRTAVKLLDQIQHIPPDIMDAILEEIEHVDLDAGKDLGVDFGAKDGTF